MLCEPHWTAYVSALLAPVVAVLGSFIAWRQWRTARNKLKLELFDRRFAVYDAARTLLLSIATSGRVEDDKLTKYIVATREAMWILNQDVDNYLKKHLYVKAVDHQTADRELDFTAPGADRISQARVKAEQRRVLLAQFEILDAKFKEFLFLEH